MYRPVIFVSAMLLFCAAHAPARAMEICEAMVAAEETRTQVAGVVTEAKSDTEYPYLFVIDEAGKCEIFVEVADAKMMHNCVKGAHVTAIGILRWDEEAAFLEDIVVNYLAAASVVCE
jgi:hypothetical protein